MGYLYHCINRNIVECKGVNMAHILAAVHVLIETLWNVKIFHFSLLRHLWHSINRNIVECKGGHRCYNACRATVLIETLWNVKEDTDVTMPVVLPY